MGELLQFIPRGKPIEIANVQIVGNALCQDVRGKAEMYCKGAITFEQAMADRDDPSVYAMDDDNAPAEYCAPDNDCA